MANSRQETEICIDIMLPLTANLNLDRYEFALRSLRLIGPRLTSKVVFDVGPGDGRMRCIEQDGFLWQGFDRAAWGSVKEWDLSLPRPESAGKADVILLLDVIEHCPNPGNALRHLSDALAEGGYIILTSPNPKWSGSRINMLLRGVASSFGERDLVENYHVFTPWPHVLERFLGEAGLAVEEYVTLDGATTLLRAEGNLFLPARYMLNLIQMGIELCDATSRGMSLGIVARRRRGQTRPMPYPTLQRRECPNDDSK